MRSELKIFEFSVGDTVVKLGNISSIGIIMQINAASLCNGVGNVFVFWEENIPQDKKTKNYPMKCGTAR